MCADVSWLQTLKSLVSQIFGGVEMANVPMRLDRYCLLVANTGVSSFFSSDRMDPS